MPRLHLNIADVRQLPYEHTQTISADYLDLMGHMNVMWYTQLFSVGMGSVLTRLGLTEEIMKAGNGGSFALEAHIRYLSEVRVDQTIQIHSRMLGRTEKRYHIMHFMTNQDKQDVSATFETVSSYVDLRQRRTAPFPDDVAAAIDDLLAEHSRLAWDAPVCGVIAP